MRHFAMAALPLLILLAPSYDFGQDKPDENKAEYQPGITLKSSTRLVIVDVVVRNGKGEAVTDLKSSDFTILENGKPQEVRIFQFQQPEAPAAAPPPSFTPSSHSPGLISNIPRYKTTGALNVILLDGLNTASPRQAYMRNRMIEFLEKLPNGEPVAVYTLGSRLQLLQDFTTDPEILKRAIQGVHRNNAAMTSNPAGGPDIVIPESFVSQLPAQMQQEIRQFEHEGTAAQTESRMSITLAALSSLTHSLSVFPGRKNLIWVSEAFPISINSGITIKASDRPDSKNFDQQISRAANTLMDSQIVIYPIDAHALMVDYVADIGSGDHKEFGGHTGEMRVQAGGYRAISGVALDSMSVDFNDRMGTRSAMEELAESTGGKAFYNRNDLDAGIRESINDGSTYYTLGYYPNDKNWDGKFRKIQVKVTRGGIKLRHRLGYYAVNAGEHAMTDPKQLKAAMDEALDLNAPASPALPFKAAVLTDANNLVTVNFGVDPHGLNFEKDASGIQHASVDCVVQAYSVTRSPVKSEATRIQADLTADNFEKVNHSYLPCQQKLELKPGNYILRLGVIDNRNGLIGTATTSVVVGEKK
jgi:VWFA-related protein